MKKTLLITLTLIAILFSTCKKDEDSASSDSLIGTSWRSDNLGTTAQPIYMMLKFTSKSTFEIWYKEYGDTAYTLDSNGVYTISGGKITLDIGDGIPVAGSIEGNTMTFVDDGDLIKFTKQ